MYSLSELDQETIFHQRFEQLKNQRDMEIALNHAVQLDQQSQRVQIPAGADKAIGSETIAVGVEESRQLEDYFDSMVDFNLYADENPIGREEGDEESYTADEEDENHEQPTVNDDDNQNNEQPTPDAELKEADEADGEGSKKKAETVASKEEKSS